MNTPIPITGLHLLAELTTNATLLLKNREQCELSILSLLKLAGFGVVGSSGYSFENMGFTVIYALAESHFSLHTWPELGYATLDLFTCNITKDNSLVARETFDLIIDLFQPELVTKREITR